MAPKLRPRRAIAVIDPVARFLKTEEGGGFALLAGSIVALLWVNVFGIGGYESFWHTELTIGIGEASISEDLGHWVNDGLMTLFFFLISLEIKREVVHGDLRRPRQAALPVIAAAGGVAVPILIFLAADRRHLGDVRVGHPDGDRRRVRDRGAGAARRPGRRRGEALPGHDRRRRRRPRHRRDRDRLHV